MHQFIILENTALLKKLKDFSIFPHIFHPSKSSLPLPSKLANKVLGKRES